MSNNKKQYQELTFKDNFIFTNVMRNPRLSKKLLEMLFGVPIAKVEVSSERTIAYHPKHRGVRLDVYIKDEENTRYNIEMQAAPKDSILKRTRYYHSQIDMDLISTGTKYKDLPNVFVIFVCDFDPLNKKKFCYTVRNQCVEDNSIKIDDGITSIYLSTMGNNYEEVSKELVNFLKFVHAELEESEMDFEDEFVKELQKSVAQIKQSRELGELYMTLQDLLDDEYEEGKVDGIKEKLVSLVDKKLKKGYTPEEIADILEEDICVITDIIKEINMADNNS